MKALSERRDSNPRPRPWQGRALPAELLSLNNLLFFQSECKYKTIVTNMSSIKQFIFLYFLKEEYKVLIKYFILNYLSNYFHKCNLAFLANKTSSDSLRSGSSTQQSTGHTAAHCGSS